MYHIYIIRYILYIYYDYADTGSMRGVIRSRAQIAHQLGSSLVVFVWVFAVWVFSMLGPVSILLLLLLPLICNVRNKPARRLTRT